MPRKLSIAAALLGCLLVIAAGGAAWWVQRSDPAQLAGALVQRVQASTGRSLRIDGPVEIRLLPRLRIVATNVAFANAPWSSVPDMLSAAHLEAQVSWVGLLRGELRITRLVLEQVEAILETDARGTGNWVMKPVPDPLAGGEKPGARDAAALMPSLGAVRISSARLRWRNGITRQERTLEVARLSLARAAAGTDRLDLDASIDGQGFQLVGTVPDSAAIAARRRGAPVDLALSADGVKVAVRGRFSFDPEGPLDLRVDAAVDRWSALSRLAGRALALPAPIGLQLHAKGRAADIDAVPLVLRLGTDELRGSASWKRGNTRNGNRSHAKLDLATGTLDLSRVTATAPAKSRRGDRLFPDTPLPFALLAAHDVEVAIRVASLRLRSGLEISALAIEGGSKQGRASLQAGDMRLADGRAGLSLEVDATATRPSVRLKASGSDLSMEKLTAVDGRARITGGSTTFTLDYAGNGSTLRALAASANGELLVSTGPARIGAGGLDLGGDLLVRLFSAINPFHAADRSTDLHCAAVRLPARAGVVTVNRSIAYETRRANVVAAGRIDLRNETLDLVVRPTIKEGLGVGAGQFAQLVRVTGPLQAPGLALDAAGALRAAVTVGGAVATGGLSLIGEALLGRRASDASPCRTALAGGRGGEAGDGKAAPPAGNPARGVIDGARRLLNLGR